MLKLSEQYELSLALYQYVFSADITLERQYTLDAILIWLAQFSFYMKHKTAIVLGIPEYEINNMEVHTLVEALKKINN